MDGFTYYKVRGNADQTEGKGGYVTRVMYLNESEAVAFATSEKGHRELGVMGYGPAGEVVRVELVVHINGKGVKTVKQHESRIWGHRRDLTGKWGYGYVDNRDAPVNDPEWAEYRRLKQKFEEP